MLKIDHIIGFTADPAIAEALQRLEHRGGIEHLTLADADMQRHRLRALTDRGTECAIALPRTQHLANGAVLLLEPDRAVVVRASASRWLVLAPRDAAAALELGYFAGNMHWKVEFAGSHLRIAVQGPVASYLERLAHLIDAQRVSEVCTGSGERHARA